MTTHGSPQKPTFAWSARDWPAERPDTAPDACEVWCYTDRLVQSVTSRRHVDEINSLADKVDYFSYNTEMQGRRIAYSCDLGFLQVDNDVRNNMNISLDLLRSLGCEVDEIKLDWTPEIFHAWIAINASRGSAAWRGGDFEKWKPFLADYTVQMIECGHHVGNEQLIRALEVHVEMYRKLGPVLESFDVFLCPTNVIPSVEAERSPFDLNFYVNGEPATRATAEGWWITYPFNMLSQLAVISVPTGFAANGVPTGMQIVGRAYDDIRILNIAAALEAANPWAHHRPTFSSAATSREGN